MLNKLPNELNSRKALLKAGLTAQYNPPPSINRDPH